MHKIGKVVEIFIPDEYKNKEILDKMYSQKIGFKIMCEGKILEIITNQNSDNISILKNDMVIIENIYGELQVRIYE